MKTRYRSRTPLRLREPRHQGPQVLPVVPDRTHQHRQGHRHHQRGPDRRAPVGQSHQERRRREQGAAGPGGCLVKGACLDVLYSDYI